MKIESTAMKPFIIFLLISAALFTSCKDDDSRSCTICNSEVTANFELCQESNGNASVNGEDTGTDYDLYFENLQSAGTTCGN